MTERDFYRKVAVNQAERAGLPGLARILMKEVQNAVIISDPQGRVLSLHCPPNITLILDDRIPLPSSARDRKVIPGTGVMAIKGVKFDFLSWPIGQERISGYLFVLGKVPLPETVHPLAEIVSLAAMIEISQQNQLAERERVYRDEFVHDILFNNFDGIDDMIRAGKVWGCDFSSSHIVAVIEPAQEESGTKEARDEIERFFAEKAPGCIIGEMANVIVILLPCPEPETSNWNTYVRNLFAGLMQRLTSGRLTAGVGKLYESVNEIYRSYQQAKVALELGKIVPERIQLAFFDELGAVRLFYNQSEQDLEEFFAEAVGCLEEYDKENTGSLLITLWHYLRSNRDTNTAKDKLYIHSNTLRYRLKKIEELLGASLEHEDTRFNLYAAMKVGAILGKIDPQITK